jgi:hypothetical protein
MANGPDNTSSSRKVLKGGAIVAVASLILGGIVNANAVFTFLNDFGCLAVRLTGHVCAPANSVGSTDPLRPPKSTPPKSTPPKSGLPSMDVPDLRGLTLENAKSQWEDEFDISVLDRQPSEKPADSVISQDPLPGEQVEHGSLISVVLSDGISGRPEETTEVTVLPPDYDQVYDDSRALTIEVPTEWSDHLGAPWKQKGFLQGQKELGVGLSASPNINKFRVGKAPGVFVGASSVLADTYSKDTVNQILALRVLDLRGFCEWKASYPWGNGLIFGSEQAWINCGKTNYEIRQIVALPPDNSYVVFVQYQLVSEGDFEIVKRITNTIAVIGQV